MPLIFRVETFEHFGVFAVGTAFALGGDHPHFTGERVWGYDCLWGFTSIAQLLAYFPRAHRYSDEDDLAPLYLAVYDCPDISEDSTQAVFNKKTGIFIQRLPLTDLAPFAPARKKVEIVQVDDSWFEVKERPRSFGLWGNWYESGGSFGRLSSSRELQQAPKPVGDWMLEIEPREKYKGRAWQANQPGDQPWKGQRP